MEKSLNEMIRISFQICELLVDTNIGNCRTKKEDLRSEFQTDLLKIGVVLSMEDGTLEAGEKDNILSLLEIKEADLDVELQKIGSVNKNELLQKISLPLKYAVLADAGRKIPQDIYRQQKAQILLDTCILFGNRLLTLKSRLSEVRSDLLSEYQQVREKFLREYGVYYTTSLKLYRPQYQYAGAQQNKEFEKNEHASEQEACDEKDPELTIQQKLDELNAMIGLSQVKKEINSLVNLLKVQKLRELNSMKTSEISMHMVFSGNPGTGKTTVARMLGDIYKGLGILSRGHLVEVDRSALVKGFIGQTAARVRDVMDEAMGGILFIDEAYTLTVNKGEGDFGQEAVDTLLKGMEDRRNQMVVIVAGYPDLMDEFLESNPGLKSRFNKFIHFEDYTSAEQMDILKIMCREKEYCLSEEAETFCIQYFEEKFRCKGENFANARDVRNFLEKAISNQAGRVVVLENPNRKALETIEASDVISIN